MDIFKNERICDFIVNQIGIIVNVEVLELTVICVKVSLNGTE